MLCKLSWHWAWMTTASCCSHNKAVYCNEIFWTNTHVSVSWAKIPINKTKLCPHSIHLVADKKYIYFCCVIIITNTVFLYTHRSSGAVKLCVSNFKPCSTFSDWRVLPRRLLPRQHGGEEMRTVILCEDDPSSSLPPIHAREKMLPYFFCKPPLLVS